MFGLTEAEPTQAEMIPVVALAVIIGAGLANNLSVAEARATEKMAIKQSKILFFIPVVF